MPVICQVMMREAPVSTNFKTDQMKNTAKIFLVLLTTTWIALPAMLCAQQKTEQIQSISGKANKGYLYEASLNEAGNIELVYNIKSGKEKVEYEVYEFEPSLKFVGSKELSTRKSRYAERPTETIQYVYATVGGGSSFNILSTKVNLFARTVTKTWNPEKQRYKSKTEKQTEIKPRNAENRTYNGNVEFLSNDGSLLLLVSSAQNEKVKEYSLLKVGLNLDMQEFPIPFDEPHVLNYALRVKGGVTDDEDEEEDMNAADMLFIFAPAAANTNTYTYVQMDINGNVKHRFTVQSPQSIMAVTAHSVAEDGSIFLCALSTEDKAPFDKLIGEYAPIENLSYLKYGTPNYKMEMHEHKMEKTKFKEFVTLKIKDGEVQWMRSTPIDVFKSKLKTPPNQKGGYSYDGKRFRVTGFYTTPDESLIVTGQVRVPVFKQAPNHMQYRDLVCFRIDNTGNVVAQYSYKPASLSDKKSLIYPIPQLILNSNNNNSLYWINFEVKVVKGYSSFANAYHGVSTYYPNYYPAIGKINLADNSIGNFEVMGNRKFMLNTRNSFVEIPDENALVFVGEDRKGKIMLAKYVFD